MNFLISPLLMPEAALRIVSHSWEFWISDLKCWSSFAGAVVILVKCARAGKIGWKRWFRGSSRFEAHYFTLHDIRNPKYKQKEAFAIIFFLFLFENMCLCHKDVPWIETCWHFEQFDMKDLCRIMVGKNSRGYCTIPYGECQLKKKPSNSLLQNPRFRCDLAQQQLYYIPQQ